MTFTTGAGLVVLPSVQPVMSAAPSMTASAESRAQMHACEPFQSAHQYTSFPMRPGLRPLPGSQNQSEPSGATAMPLRPRPVTGERTR